MELFKVLEGREGCKKERNVKLKTETIYRYMVSEVDGVISFRRLDTTRVRWRCASPPTVALRAHPTYDVPPPELLSRATRPLQLSTARSLSLSPLLSPTERHFLLRTGAGYSVTGDERVDFVTGDRLFGRFISSAIAGKL